MRYGLPLGHHNSQLFALMFLDEVPPLHPKKSTASNTMAETVTIFIILFGTKKKFLSACSGAHGTVTALS